MRIADNAPAFDILRPQALQVEILRQAEYLTDGDGTRRRRSHPAHIKSAIIEADRCALDHTIVGQVGQRQDARIVGGFAHGLDDRFGDCPLVKSVGTAFGKHGKRFRIGRILQHGTGLQGGP